MDSFQWVFHSRFIEIEFIPFVILVLSVLLMIVVLFWLVRIELNKGKKEKRRKNEK